jgi:FMN phosphatase YigB (HAD superfamily)
MRIKRKHKSVAEIRSTIMSNLDRFDVISFDVFDTLLRRCIYPPELIKERSAALFSEILKDFDIEAQTEYILDCRQLCENKLRKEASDLGYDPECDFEQLAYKLVEHVLADLMQLKIDKELIADLSNRFIECEIYLELETSIPNSEMCALYRELQTIGKRTILTSDMYLSSEHIKILLNKNDVTVASEDCYVSSKSKLCKWSGRLFKHWLDVESVTPDRVIHIGDNPQSDYLSAIREGLNVILYIDPQENRRRAELQSAYQLSEKHSYWQGAYTLRICNSLKKATLSNDFLYDYGYHFLGPAFSAYIHCVVEKIKLYKIDHVLFLAREGFLFQKIYDCFNSQLGLSGLQPTTFYACLSRYSTGLASVQYLSPREIQTGTYKMHQQGLASVLKTYGLPQQLFASIAAEYGIYDITEPIYDCYSHPGVLGFLGDARVQDAVAESRTVAKKKLSTYLDDCNFWGRNRKVALLDVGWEGTIQDNLIHAFGQRSDFPILYGLYFGRVKGRNFLQYSPSISEGLMYDFRRRDISEQSITNFVQIFEQAARAPHGSTLTYELNYEEQVEPVFKPENSQDRKDEIDLNPSLAILQQGILDFADCYSKAIFLTGYSSVDVKPYILANISRFINLPRRKEAWNILNKMKHSEDFGANNSLSLGINNFQTFSIKQWLYMINEYSNVFWKQGTLKISGVPGLPFLFSILRNTTRNPF